MRSWRGGRWLSKPEDGALGSPVWKHFSNPGGRERLLSEVQGLMSTSLFHPYFYETQGWARSSDLASHQGTTRQKRSRRSPRSDHPRVVLSDLHGSEILWGTQDGHRSVPPESVPSSAKVPHDHHNDVQTSLRKGQWAASIDLKDAYFQVPIHPGARKFFRVAWEGKVYQFRALPFGLASAPWLFTELVRPLVEWAHRKGITMFAYLDDWLIVADSRTACQAAVQTVLSLARELGFRINVEKSELVPAQVFTFLGVEFDLSLGLVRPTVERVQKILEAIQDLLAATHRTARYWLHALGLLNSSFHTIQLGRLRGRPVQRYLASVWAI